MPVPLSWDQSENYGSLLSDFISGCKEGMGWTTCGASLVTGKALSCVQEAKVVYVAHPFATDPHLGQN